MAEFATRQTPVIVVFNKADAARPDQALWDRLTERELAVVLTSATEGTGMLELRQALLAAAPPDFIDSPAIVGDLVGPGEMAVLVVPIDKEAPKGRLILPQVQAIRDLLDSDAYCLVVKERELRAALDRLKDAAQAGRHRFAGVPESRGRYAAARAADEFFDPDFAVQRRPADPGRRARWPSIGFAAATACWWPRPARTIRSARTSGG